MLDKLLEKSKESKITGTNPQEIKKEEKLEHYIKTYTNEEDTYKFSLDIKGEKKEQDQMKKN